MSCSIKVHAFKEVECILVSEDVFPNDLFSPGFVKMRRFTSLDREELKKKEKEQRKLLDEELGRPVVWIKYTLGLKHQVRIGFKVILKIKLMEMNDDCHLNGSTLLKQLKFANIFNQIPNTYQHLSMLVNMYN